MFSRSAFNILHGTAMIGMVLVLIQCGPKPQESKTASPAAAQPAAPATELAGQIFDVPVPMGNYYFAKRVHGMFQTPEERAMTPEQMEQHIWHNLVLSFEASRRQIEVTEEEFSQWVDSVLSVLELKFTRTANPDEYKKWIEETLKQSVELFENQMRYLATIEKLKREIVKEMQVTVTEEEMRQDYLNTENHVGGEYLLFDTQAEADAFYESNKDIAKWESYKAANPDKVKPFMLITVQAIVDLWGVPQAQIDEFHAMPIGQVGKPLPFGKQIGVFRLLDKRTGDFSNYETKKENLQKRVEARKKYQAGQDWIKNIDREANIQVWVKPEPTT